MATAADGRNQPAPSSPDDDICRSIDNEKCKLWRLYFAVTLHFSLFNVAAAGKRAASKAQRSQGSA